MMDSSGPETYVPHTSHKQVVPEQPRQHESSYYAPTTPETYSSIPVKNERTICGLRPATFVLSVLLATVIVVAAVGGGVGGSLAVQKARDDAMSSVASPTTVVTTTVTSLVPASTDSDSPIVVPTQGKIQLPCPAMKGETRTIALSDVDAKFVMHCGMSFGAKGALDIVAVVVYSYLDCLRACASYNRNSGSKTCVAATFNANLGNIGPNNGNCWLKNATSPRSISHNSAVGGILD
ncbi:hypothetical protein CaCOL14_011941 [Colletotrichum acutatum]